MTVDVAGRRSRSRRWSCSCGDDGLRRVARRPSACRWSRTTSATRPGPRRRGRRASCSPPPSTRGATRSSSGSAAPRRTTPARGPWSGSRAPSGLPGPADVARRRRRAARLGDRDDLAGLRRAARPAARRRARRRDRRRRPAARAARRERRASRPQKGATPEQAQDLERALGHFAHAATAPSATRPPGPARRRAPRRGVPARRAPGAGAAGGLGFGLALLGAPPGARLGLRGGRRRASTTLIAAADVVVTGEGRFDWQSLHGKVASEVASRALAARRPDVVARRARCWWVVASCRAAGITAAYAVGGRPSRWPRALAAPAQTLAARVAARVARTWSR